MKVIVAHPGQQHSFHVAQAVKKAGCLDCFVTAIYDKDSSFLMKLVKRFAGEKNRKKALNRKCDALDDREVLQFYPFLSLMVIVLSRYVKKVPIGYWLDRKIADWFGVKLAKLAIKRKVDMVICFSMNERTCFEYLEKHAPNIQRVVDCANSPINYMRYIYDKDIEKTKCSNIKKECPSFWNDTICKKQKQAIQFTQFFLAPSMFVAKGLKFNDVNPEDIIIIPYGSNFQVAKEIKSKKGKIKFLYVGQITYRKGVHHLLNVVESMPDIDLTLVGSYNAESPLYKDYYTKEHIHFTGHIAHDKVRRYMHEADVFVFPSLSEGFSLSCLEALSQGLPVICTENSGSNDAVINGENGFVVEAGNEEKLKNAIEWIVCNSDSIEKMSKNALESSKKYTWELYEENMNAVLKELER